jgi:hypothetical protein
MDKVQKHNSSDVRFEKLGLMNILYEDRLYWLYCCKYIKVGTKISSENVYKLCTVRLLKMWT